MAMVVVVSRPAFLSHRPVTSDSSRALAALPLLTPLWRSGTIVARLVCPTRSHRMKQSNLFNFEDHYCAHLVKRSKTEAMVVNVWGTMNVNADVDNKTNGSW